MTRKLPKAVRDAQPAIEMCGGYERVALAGRAMRLLLRITDKKRDRPSLHCIGIVGLLIADKKIRRRAEIRRREKESRG